MIVVRVVVLVVVLTAEVPEAVIGQGCCSVHIKPILHKIRESKKFMSCQVRGGSFIVLDILSVRPVARSQWAF